MKKNFNIEAHPFTKYMYKKKKWAFVSDYVRFHALYDQGGFYLDTDMEILKSLNPLTIYDTFFCYAANPKLSTRKHITAGAFGVQKNSPIMKRILKNYSNKLFLLYFPFLPLWKISSPRMITKTFNNMPEKMTKNVEIFSFDYFLPATWEDVTLGKELKKENFVTSNSFTFHWFDHSWSGKTD